MQKTATFVATFGEPQFRGKAKLYKLTPGISYPDCGARYNHVIVSAADVPFDGPETFIFPANEDGSVICWRELPGSFRGKLNHEWALRRAGYDIA